MESHTNDQQHPNQQHRQRSVAQQHRETQSGGQGTYEEAHPALEAGGGSFAGDAVVLSPPPAPRPSPPQGFDTNMHRNPPPLDLGIHPQATPAGGAAADDEDGAAIVRNIASFLTFSDVASMATTSLGGGGGASGDFMDGVSPADSWAVGTGGSTSSMMMMMMGAGGDPDLSWCSVATPPTPALVAVSPGATPAANFGSYDLDGDNNDNDNFTCERDQDIHDDDEDEDSVYLEHLLQERRRRWAQEKLASAVFSHPHPLRSFCLDAYSAAQDIRSRQEKQQATAAADGAIDEGLGAEDEGGQPRSKPLLPGRRRRSRNEVRLLLLHSIVDLLFHNVPLSVMFDVADVLVGVSLDTSFAAFQLTIKSINGIVSALAYSVCFVWDTIVNFNPFQLLEAFISLQFNAMGKTSEVLVSGIQSVATGVGSASSIALHRLSAANLSISGVTGNGPGSSLQACTAHGDLHGSARHLQRGHRGAVVHSTNKKLLRKMSSLNEAARVVSYMEIGDDTGGLTRHAISRTRRMMHYSVSLRPFVATVAVKSTEKDDSSNNDQSSSRLRGSAGDPAKKRPKGDQNIVGEPGAREGGVARLVSDGEETSDCDSSTMSPSTAKWASPFISSPQSFPPTPRSRQMVLARGSQFADDVVFLARDRLRIHDGLESGNERTREMAWALREGKRLAIFDGHGVNGIELTCGQHVATKCGNMHYASTRSMVPILRNCYVYFEITVMPRLNYDLAVQSPLTLSIGLSTVEMPPNTLVGAWQGSVGLCTTGQIFVAGQWCSPADPSMSAYGPNATVGCLVFLDDSSAFETWDGVMVNASVTFSINGQIVPPPVTHFPLPGTATAGRGSASQVSDAAAPQPPSGNGSIVYTMPTLLVPASEELYPTVTLQTPATAVMCRFSSEDVIGTNIGAPSTATVYAVDGSVILSPEDA